MRWRNERERERERGKVGLPVWPVGKDHCPSDILDFVE
jgi:hypothetical protein